jgi:hypothetical protein
MKTTPRTGTGPQVRAHEASAGRSEANCVECGRPLVGEQWRLRHPKPCAEEARRRQNRINQLSKRARTPEQAAASNVTEEGVRIEMAVAAFRKEMQKTGPLPSHRSDVHRLREAAETELANGGIGTDVWIGAIELARDYAVSPGSTHALSRLARDYWANCKRWQKVVSNLVTDGTQYRAEGASKIARVVMALANDVVAEYADDTRDWLVLRHQAAQFGHRLGQMAGEPNAKVFDRLLGLAGDLNDAAVWRETHATAAGHFAQCATLDVRRRSAEIDRALHHLQRLFGARFPPSAEDMNAVAPRPYSQIGLWRAVLEVAKLVNPRLTKELAGEVYLPLARRFGNLYQIRVASSFGVDVGNAPPDAVVIPLFQY